MMSFEYYATWIVSFLVLIVFLYASYRVSYSFGIKKALYRTTYILICIILAFILTPVFNKAIFGLDLSDFNITLKYKNQEFYTLIDYIEEVIAHSNFLNDLYRYFPSLKQLFIDFPQVILTPVTYVLLFLTFMILLFPVYLFLSYKRKRRILYEREDRKRQRVWAGVIGCVQCILLFSIILTPINGLNRIYQTSIDGTLDEQYSSICEENSALNKYSNYCDLIESYDATVFSMIGGKYSANRVIFDSLTRIAYDDGYTNLENEISAIVKSGIILDQSGLLSILDSNSDVIPVSLLLNTTLSDEELDSMIETLYQSKYSENLVDELNKLVVNTLSLVLGNVYDGKLPTNYSFTNAELISEIKIVLRALRLLDDEMLASIIEAKNLIVYFDEEIPDYKIDDVVVFDFINDLVNILDIDRIVRLCEQLYKSKIFKSIIPYILNDAFVDLGINFVKNKGDILPHFYNVVEFARLMKKYNPVDFFVFIVGLTDDELIKFANIVDYEIHSPEFKGLLSHILALAFAGTFVETYPLGDVYKINNWEKEIYVVRELCQLMVHYNETGEYDGKIMISVVGKQNSSDVSKIVVNILQRNFPNILRDALS